VDPPVEGAPDVLPVIERREVLDSAAAIVDAVAPEMFAERRAELAERERRDKRGWKFWRR
jgi:hypothetical protein